MPKTKLLSADRITSFPLAERVNQLSLDSNVTSPDQTPEPLTAEAERLIDGLVGRVVEARRRDASVMMVYGAHLVKNRAGLVVRQLIEEGWLTHLATQGAGVIHDWEFAYQGQTGESVKENAPAGRFGTWDETGCWINLAVIAGVARGLGFGESIGRLITDNGITLPELNELEQQIREALDDPLTPARCDLLWTMRHFNLQPGRYEVQHPHRAISILAAAWENQVPMSIHPGIGYDIIANHPMYHGAAIGRASHIDMRLYGGSVDQLDGGVYLSIGSAIMSPQVFEKAYSAANNIRRSEGRPMISDHTIAVVDLQDTGGWDWSQGEPPQNNPAYYLRFCKSFHRMGGTLQYYQCDNRTFLLHLLHRLRRVTYTG